MSLEELDELSRSVGVRFGLKEGETWDTKEPYVYTLHEADDFEKVFRYLDEHGV